MAPRHLLLVASLSLSLALPRGAAAQTAASGPPEAPPVVPAAPVAAPATPPAAPVTVLVPVNPPPAEAVPSMVVPAVQLTVPWNGPTGRGVSIGMEEGAWSGVWGSGLRVFVPFFERIGGPYGGSIGMTLRGLVLTGSSTSTPAAPADHYGGRFELVGRSPVFLNLVRLYGGGGVEVFSPFGSGFAAKALVSGGGHFGFEFFLNRRFSFYLEVGGHGGVDAGLPGGETVIAGMNVYPFFS